MEIKEITLPEMGDLSQANIVEVHISPGDKIKKDDPVISMETEKAALEIPSPYEGVIKEVKVSLEDKPGQGMVLALIEMADRDSNDQETIRAEPVAEKAEAAPLVADRESRSLGPDSLVHASPSVRKMAREMKVDLAGITGTGPKNRILKSDVQAAAQSSGKAAIVQGAAQESETLEPLSRIRKISGQHLQQCWQDIPHVTHFDEACIDGLEEFRNKHNLRNREGEPGYSPLAFIVKAVTATLKQFPHFNSSLNPEKDSLIVKHYYNIGIAVDTPNGLLVPVIKDANQKGAAQLNREIREIAARARESTLGPREMQGATFTISSLGGIGGTNFTPIINAPQVAILGVSKSKITPVWDGAEFKPCAMLPFALSYDHRVADGAEAARFCRVLAGFLQDLRELIL